MHKTLLVFLVLLLAFISFRSEAGNGRPGTQAPVHYVAPYYYPPRPYYPPPAHYRPDLRYVWWGYACMKQVWQTRTFCNRYRCYYVSDWFNVRIVHPRFCR